MMLCNRCKLQKDTCIQVIPLTSSSKADKINNFFQLSLDDKEKDCRK